MPDLDPDAQLMSRLQAGDDLALNDLMSRWQKPLAAFIHRYVGNEADALDLAQETFVRVYESRRRYKPRAKFSTWLFTIASNLCRNHARWKARHPTVALSAGPDREEDHNVTLTASAPSPAENAERTDRGRLVRQAVDTLPHDLKTVVLLFEYQEMSYQEIGGVLRCSPKAVETRLYRARKILRERLSLLAQEQR